MSQSENLQSILQLLISVECASARDRDFGQRSSTGVVETLNMGIEQVRSEHPIIAISKPIIWIWKGWERLYIFNATTRERCKCDEKKTGKEPRVRKEQGEYLKVSFFGWVETSWDTMCTSLNIYRCTLYRIIDSAARRRRMQCKMKRMHESIFQPWWSKDDALSVDNNMRAQNWNYHFQHPIVGPERDLWSDIKIICFFSFAPSNILIRFNIFNSSSLASDQTKSLESFYFRHFIRAHHFILKHGLISSDALQLMHFLSLILHYMRSRWECEKTWKMWWEKKKSVRRVEGFRVN